MDGAGFGFGETRVYRAVIDAGGDGGEENNDVVAVVPLDDGLWSIRARRKYAAFGSVVEGVPGLFESDV